MKLIIILMRKALFIGCLLLAGLSAMADDVQKIDATKVSKITFSGNNVTITFNDGSQAVTVDMETVTIDFSTVTSVEERLAVTQREGLEGKPVYDLSGQLVGNSAARLSKGVYIVNGKKVIIK